MKNIIPHFILFTMFFSLNITFGSDDKKRDNSRMQKSEIRKHFLDENQSKKTSRGVPLFPGANQVDLLRSLLDAPPEKLRILRQTIERVEGMSLERKKEIKHRLRSLRNLKPEVRTKELKMLRHRQNILGKYWQTLEPVKRKEEMRKFYKLCLADRTQYFNTIKAEH